MKFLTGILILGLGLTSAATTRAEKWKIDPVHSSVQFSIRHMMVSNLRGKFSKFEGSIDYDGKDLGKAKVEAIIQASSVDTANADRDEHVRGEDFFDVAKFPTLEFRSRSMIAKQGNLAQVEGDLLMHGVTKPVTLEAEIHGIGKGMGGESRIGFTAKTTIDRKEWGIVWNKFLDGGGLGLGNEVQITLEIEAVEVKPESAARPEPAGQTASSGISSVPAKIPGAAAASLAALLLPGGIPAPAGAGPVPVTADPVPARLLASSDPKLAANKRLVYDFFRIVLRGRRLDQVEKYLDEGYIQHNPLVATGRKGFVDFFSKRSTGTPPPIPEVLPDVVAIQAEGDLVTLSFVDRRADPGEAGARYTTTWFDMFRVRDGRIVEHWDNAVK